MKRYCKKQRERSMLNANQELFCQEYKKDRNGARAYRAAYPNCNSGHDVCACKLLRITKIKARIAVLMAELVKKVNWDVAESERRYKEAYDLANTCKQPSAMVSAVQAVNKMYGLDTDKGYADTAKPLTPQQQKDYDKLARDMNIRIARETA